MKKFKIIKGDTVVVLTGKDKGKKGAVISVLRESQRVIVDGVNMKSKHVKARPPHESGGIVKKPMSVHISNVGVYDHSIDKHAKVGFRFDDIGKKERYFKSSGKTVK